MADENNATTPDQSTPPPDNKTNAIAFNKQVGDIKTLNAGADITKMREDPTLSFSYDNYVNARVSRGKSNLGEFFYDVLRKSDNFKLILYDTDIGESIVNGYITSNFDFAISANYSTPFGGLGSAVEGLTQLFNTGKFLMGSAISATHGLTGVLKWESSVVNDFSVSFDVLATSSEDNTVAAQLIRLSRYILPEHQNSMFLYEAPNKYRWEGIGELTKDLSVKQAAEAVRGSVSLKVGKYLNIRKLVMTSLTYVFDKEVMKGSGYPLKASVTIGLKTVLPMDSKRFASWVTAVPVEDAAAYLENTVGA